MKEQWNRQTITAQSNASPLPGCFSTPPFISLPPPPAIVCLPKRIASTSPPFGSSFQCSNTTPFRHPCLEHLPPEEKYIEGRRKEE
ncbi:hypothetical protein CEXT_395191 [Caerostris extrusa]|uniref:Uncharacterized protein n=1 Tax=Caerostris extrusa TaxID=172846 RepID=A0AAV4WCE0_CAEEX|nr:hypothetical protein CEXT_395191 [Caerostris extrusa]